MSTTTTTRRRSIAAACTMTLAAGILAAGGNTAHAAGTTGAAFRQESTNTSHVHFTNGKWAYTSLMGLDTDRDGTYETSVYCIEETVLVDSAINTKGGYYPYDWNTYQPSRDSAPYWNTNKAQVA